MFTYQLPVRRFAYRHQTGNSCIAAWENSSMFTYLLPLRRFAFRHLTGNTCIAAWEKSHCHKGQGKGDDSRLGSCTTWGAAGHMCDFISTKFISLTAFHQHTIKTTACEVCKKWKWLLIGQQWHDYHWSLLYSRDMIIIDPTLSPSLIGHLASVDVKQHESWGSAMFFPPSLSPSPHLLCTCEQF